MSVTVQQMETPLLICGEFQLQHIKTTPVPRVSGISPQLEKDDQSMFSVVSNNEITRITKSAASKNTIRTTKTWLNVWQQWCLALSTDDKMEPYSPQVLDEILI